MTSGYDKLAPVYDRLAVFFVGKQIQQAQLKWLSYLSDRKKLLILGGGTGWMLPAVFQINPNLVIHYVDASAKMIAQAKAKAQSPLIQFTKGTETDIPDRDYDAVLTHFYLDLFSDDQLPNLIAKLKMRLTNNALWLVTDFETHTMHCNVLRFGLMYLFFRMMTGLKTQALPKWYNTLTNAGCIALKSYCTQHKFIRSVVFRVKRS
jgi:tRNA (cmo5U34)-methyltransferase